MVVLAEQRISEGTHPHIVYLGAAVLSGSEWEMSGRGWSGEGKFLEEQGVDGGY